MNPLETTIHKIAQYAETLTSIAAAAVSAIDTSQLPPKWAAGVITAAGVIRVVREFVNREAAILPPVPAPASAPEPGSGAGTAPAPATPIV